MLRQSVEEGLRQSLAVVALFRVGPQSVYFVLGLRHLNLHHVMLDKVRGIEGRHVRRAVLIDLAGDDLELALVGQQLQQQVPRLVVCHATVTCKIPVAAQATVNVPAVVDTSAPASW